MVAPNSPRLGVSLSPCLARPMLYAALECLDRGDYIGAGVRLREAVTRFVKSGCEWYGCPPKGKHPRPCDYVRALRKAKQIDEWNEEFLLEMITTGNRAAHLQSLDRKSVRGCIGVLFAFMDGEPYCPMDRKPVVSSHKSCQPEDDYGDDGEWDSADWWKEGGGE